MYFQPSSGSDLSETSIWREYVAAGEYRGSLGSEIDSIVFESYLRYLIDRSEAHFYLHRDLSEEEFVLTPAGDLFVSEACGTALIELIEETKQQMMLARFNHLRPASLKQTYN